MKRARTSRATSGNVQPVSDEFLMQVAHSIGSASAASQAIAERDRRQAAGENAVVLWDRDTGTLLVGLAPLSADQAKGE